MEKEAKKTELSELRLPPYSKEAEESILGALLIDNSTMDIIEGRLTADDFYDYGNRLIYEQIFELINSGRPADVITVADGLKERGHEFDTGGMEYLNRLSDYSAGTANIFQYAEIIKDRAVRRRLISVGNEITADSFRSEGKAAVDLIDSAQAKVLAISEQLNHSSGTFISVSSAISAVEDQLKFLKENPIQEGQTRGSRTGFADLDRMTDGLHDGELIIVAGRPAMGKTAFALNIAMQVALDGLPVGIFSLEMGADQLATRLISSLGSIPQDELKTGKLTTETWANFYKTTQKLKDVKIMIDQSSSLTIFNIRSRARQLKSRFGKLGLIVVDYLQLVYGENSKKTENRATEVAEISRGLKGLARELGVPVIALSQLSRKVDDRKESKRPMMSDLRESGAIEQDADLILFLYRECVYNPVEGNEKEAELIIGKQRSGPTGTVPLLFEGEFTRFRTKAYEFQDDEGYPAQD